jgi:hypothetical protein
VVHGDDFGTFTLAVLITLTGTYGTFTFLVPLLQEPHRPQNGEGDVARESGVRAGTAGLLGVFCMTPEKVYFSHTSPEWA